MRDSCHSDAPADAGRTGGGVPSGATSDPHRPDGSIALRMKISLFGPQCLHRIEA